jgi:hypothetical protein
MTLAVQVVAQTQIIAGARVRVRGDCVDEVAQTDSGGRAYLPYAAPCDMAIAVDVDGYPTCESHVVQPLPTEIVIDILACGTLAGSVTSSSFSIDISRLTVLAFPWLHPPPCADVHADGGKEGPVKQASVAATGEFKIEGLDPTRGYDLVCGGLGWLSDRLEAPAIPGGNYQLLTVRPVLGVSIRLVDAEGGSIRSNRALVESGSTSVSCSEPGFIAALLQDWEIVWAEVPGFSCGSLDKEGLDLLARSPPDKERVGPILLSIGHPGYKRARRMTYAEPVIPEVRIFEIPLERTADCWASLEVSFVGSSKHPLLASDPSSGGVLYLTRSDGTDYGLALGTNGLQSFSGIPCGHYQAKYVYEKLFAYPSRTSHLDLYVDEGGASLEIDLSRAGSLVVDLLDEQDRPISDRAVLQLEVQGRLGLWAVAFEARPYLVRALEPGRYNLIAFRGRARPPFGREPYRATFEIQSGEVAEVTLRPEP